MSNMAWPRQLHPPQLLFIRPFGRRLWTKQHSQPGELNNDLAETSRNGRTRTWWQWRDGMENGWKWQWCIDHDMSLSMQNPVLAGYVALFHIREEVMTLPWYFHVLPLHHLSCCSCVRVTAGLCTSLVTCEEDLLTCQTCWRRVELAFRTCLRLKRREVWKLL